MHLNKKSIYPKEECGIVAIANLEEAAKFTYLCLHALQHRGQESTGIASANKNSLYRYTTMGRVVKAFSAEKLEALKGDHAIGHNRYSTTGHSLSRNTQPIRVETRFGTLAIAHNGNLINYWGLRKKLEGEGSIFLTTIDTEVIVHLIAKSQYTDFHLALIEALKQIKGAYCITILMKDVLYVIRDPYGFRPLVMGRRDEDDSIIFASETCALDIIDATYERSIKPGEVVCIKNNHMTSVFPFERQQSHLCIFELIYFSRHDSIIFNKSVYNVRYKLGELLARDFPADADLVISVPDSSNIAALGFASYSKLPFHFGLFRSHYIGRTFIEPDQKIRDFGAKLKYNGISSIVKDKKVIVIDDSIVRGTTQKKVVKTLKKAGIKEIHIRIASAPTRHPCYYGIDIPTKEELIANQYNNLEEIRKTIDVDSIHYLSEETMQEAANLENQPYKSESEIPEGYCLACFNGKYPMLYDDMHYSNTENQKLLFQEYQIEES